MSLDDKRILITGGLGQIGFAILTRLRSSHPTAQLHVLDLSLPQKPLPGVGYNVGSISDGPTVHTIFEAVKPEVVFHTAGLIPQIAARLGLNRKEEYLKVNVEGTRVVIEEAKRVGVKAFVMTSSADVVKGGSWDDMNGVKEDMKIPEKFDGWYAESKAKAEILALTASSPVFPTIALRTHGCFSPNDTNLLPLVLSAPRNIRLGPGTNLYDFTYAPNLAQAQLLAATNLLGEGKEAAGKAMFVTNAEPVLFKDFMAWIWDAYEGESGVKVWEIPVSVAKLMIWLGEKAASIAGKKPVLTVKELGDSVTERWFDNGEAKRVLGYVPEVALREGVKIAVEGYKASQANIG